MKKLYFLTLTLSVFNLGNAQIINFPDPNFKAKLLQSAAWNYIAQVNNVSIKLDANSDGEIQVSEALIITALDLQGDANISNLTGISNFTNLITLQVYNNPLLTGIDLSGLNNLQYLNCPNNSLATINNIGAPNLTKLDCWNNDISEVDVTNWPNLEELLIDGNQLTSLSITNMPTMQRLFCSENNLTSLNLHNLPNLYTIDTKDNQLSAMSLSGLGAMLNFDCSVNQLTAVDLGLFPLATNVSVENNLLQTVDASMLYNLTYLDCDINPALISILSKNGRNETISFNSCPAVQYICVDDPQLADIQWYINSYNLTNCFVNSYCSFVPGGIFYTISGSNKLDNDNNGCDPEDMIIPNFKFAIASGASSGTFISNEDGGYSLPVGAGSHTITPVLQYPAYFNVSPTTFIVDFPTQVSPLLQDYCITPNGYHPDMEVVMFPFLFARPGFDSYYTISCKNNGNITQSGTVNVQFNGAVLDLVNTVPTALSTTENSISFEFNNLQPFQTQLFGVVLNVNSPMETPAVNAGDILSFTAIVETAATDDTPVDNTASLSQTVVNSFDPNAKTCLEGAAITPQMVGEYVHYIVQFENTGTFPAENIVVKDMIDTTRFDITSLVPLHGSHPFTTRISSNNKVEFIFENINLPFDDANNDGYVAFKIKTKPTLVVGDTFSNTASIYFDYNFPIITNTATTTIAALSNPDFEFSDYFTLYPNPVKNELNIKSAASIEVRSISIYNLIGQLVLTIPNAQNVSSIDISGLNSGNYFVKINSDRGSSNGKFIKE
jgi:hypothetical protein